MKLENLERAHSLVGKKRGYEHAIKNIKKDTTLTLAFHGKPGSTKGEGGQIHIELEESGAAYITGFIRVLLTSIDAELEDLGVDVG